MSHRKLGTIKKTIRKYDVAELRALLIFIQTLLGSSMPKARRKGAGAGKARRHGAKHRLRAGVHRVKVGKRMRNVRVLANGKWRFMKG